MRAALIDNGTVLNVIVVDPDNDYTPPDGTELVELADDVVIEPGWLVNGTGYRRPPHRELTGGGVAISPDGVSTTVVTYTDTHDDAPDTVTFTVNGATKVVQLTAAGNAFLDVVSSTPGDTITVTVDALPDAVVTITVDEEAPSA